MKISHIKRKSRLESENAWLLRKQITISGLKLIFWTSGQFIEQHKLVPKVHEIQKVLNNHAPIILTKPVKTDLKSKWHDKEISDIRRRGFLSQKRRY